MRNFPSNGLGAWGPFMVMSTQPIKLEQTFQSAGLELPIRLFDLEILAASWAIMNACIISPKFWVGCGGGSIVLEFGATPEWCSGLYLAGSMLRGRPIGAGDSNVDFLHTKDVLNLLN